MGSLMNSDHQLALPVQLPDHARFDNFVVGSGEVGEAHALLVAHLQRIASAAWRPEHQYTYLFGSSGRGKTHLLCALCEQCAEQGRTSIYLSLREFHGVNDVSILQGLERYDVIALDDVQAVCDQGIWCDALFALFNRVQDAGNGFMVLAADHSIARLPIVLPDLRSRMQWASPYQLRPLPDADKVMVLQQHAQERGLELTEGVGEFIVQRLSRDLHELMGALEQLDQASMARQRRLTLPFVKQVLAI
ncbi:DnaA regulatory inactivator Hda [Aliidiomarina indica]|uniref:DnaA regulatory inactivator Hda n=1 Tax=Aliidiomarina indica TaxID=2749147 RepID=UPI00188EF058|nr:DnaA regulatory inactivator Hda [Aliidiomarina indica]